MASIIICGFTIINKPNTMNNIEDEIDLTKSILKKHIILCYQTEAEMEDSFDGLYEEICAAMEEYAENKVKAALQKQQYNVIGEWISKAKKELLEFVQTKLTNKLKRRTDDYEHIGATIEAKIHLVFKSVEAAPPNETQSIEQRNESENDNCSQHKKDIAGISDMKVLAEMIGDLHYESLSNLILKLSIKLMQDADRDEASNKHTLANELSHASYKLRDVYDYIFRAWQISKPFMET